MTFVMQLIHLKRSQPMISTANGENPRLVRHGSCSTHVPVVMNQYQTTDGHPGGMSLLRGALGVQQCCNDQVMITVARLNHPRLSRPTGIIKKVVEVWAGIVVELPLMSVAEVEDSDVACPLAAQMGLQGTSKLEGALRPTEWLILH
jgi:hypothetical protein